MMPQLLMPGILVAALALPAYAETKIPLSAAMAQCRPLDGPSAVAKAHYRECVLARSGKMPQAPEGKTKGGITISGSARIGIVVQSD